MRASMLFLFFLPLSLATLPEESMTTPELISYQGYTAEIVTVTTEDGYILEMHRIPCGRNETLEDVRRRNQKRPVVFLQHGLLGSSADWVLNLPNQSAAFVFADAGFDVWIGNVRGNYYSRRHVKYTVQDKEFWQFTFDEFAAKDLPAMVNRALNVTGMPDLYYIGHSQGTLIGFAKFSEDQEFAKKIRRFYALAPVGTVDHIRGLFAFLGRYMAYGFKEIFTLFGENEFFPSTWLTKLFARAMCGFKFMNPLCENILFQIAGPETNQFNQTRLLVYMEHDPAGTSTANILHWIQMVHSDTAQKYDFNDPQKNIEHYGQPQPPLYDFSKIRVPMYLYYSDADWLADTTDIKQHLLPVLPKEFVKAKKKLEDFNHFDFLWGVRAANEIYADIKAKMVRDVRTRRMY